MNTVISAPLSERHTRRWEKSSERSCRNHIFSFRGTARRAAAEKILFISFNEDGLGAIVNSSRGIIAAYKQEAYAKFGAENFGDASRAAVEDMIADISGALESAK